MTFSSIFPLNVTHNSCLVLKINSVNILNCPLLHPYRLIANALNIMKKRTTQEINTFSNQNSLHTKLDFQNGLPILSKGVHQLFAKRHQLIYDGHSWIHGLGLILRIFCPLASYSRKRTRITDETCMLLNNTKDFWNRKVHLYLIACHLYIKKQANGTHGKISKNIPRNVIMDERILTKLNSNSNIRITLFYLLWRPNLVFSKVKRASALGRD